MHRLEEARDGCHRRHGKGHSARAGGRTRGRRGDTSAPPGQRPPVRPDGAAILAIEHWSLLASRSLIWNEALSRATVFLSVLSAATIALAHGTVRGTATGRLYGAPATKRSFE